jgi:hypothetical protein
MLVSNMAARSPETPYVADEWMPLTAQMKTSGALLAGIEMFIAAVNALLRQTALQMPAPLDLAHPILQCAACRVPWPAYLCPQWQFRGFCDAKCQRAFLPQSEAAAAAPLHLL